MQPILAMHMANNLVSCPVSLAVSIVVAGAIVVSAARWRKDLSPGKLSLMAGMGALVFGGQMINFTLPGMPGTSGHLIGAVLLAIALGPAGGILCMAAILTIQCLLFNDGGLMALGCNILNMGVVPCLLGWRIYRWIRGPSESVGVARGALAAWVASIAGATAGAVLVPIEALASGVLRIPVFEFLGVMVGVHLLIGVFEGAITVGVLQYLRQVRPSAVGERGAADRLSGRQLAALVVLAAVLLAGVVSWFASTYDDGLEWSYLVHRYGPAEQAVVNTSPIVADVETWQGRWSPLPDYALRETALGVGLPEEASEEGAAAWPAIDAGGSLAGVAGTLATLIVLIGLGGLLSRRRRVEPAGA